MKKTFTEASKIVILVGIITFLSGSLQAQVRGGIKAGANFWYSAWEIPGISQRYSGISYHLGIFGNLPLRPEAIWLQTEFQFNSFAIDYSGELYTANYFSLPVVCAFSFLNNKLDLHAGPQISLLLSAKPETLETAIDNWELAFVVGSGVTIKRFNLTARYILGITNLASNEVREIFPEATIKNSNFQVSLAYQFLGETR